MALGSVYALIDPRNGEMRYVGQAVDVRRRLKHHVGFCNTAGRRGRCVRGLRFRRDGGRHPAGCIVRLEVVKEAIGYGRRTADSAERITFTGENTER